METIEITVHNPFDMEYKRGSEVLFLTCVEAALGRQAVIRFDPAATQALWHLLAGTVAMNGGTIGDAGTPPPVQ